MITRILLYLSLLTFFACSKARNNPVFENANALKKQEVKTTQNESAVNIELLKRIDELEKKILESQAEQSEESHEIMDEFQININSLKRELRLLKDKLQVQESKSSIDHIKSARNNSYKEFRAQYSSEYIAKTKEIEVNEVSPSEYEVFIPSLSKDNSEAYQTIYSCLVVDDSITCNEKSHDKSSTDS